MHVHPKFIVLTDFSENAPAVIRYARQCSMAAGDSLMVLHKAGMMLSGRIEQDVKRKLRQENQLDSFRDLSAYLAGVLPDMNNVKFEVTVGSLVSALQKLQVNNSPNLVFSGLKITGPLKQKLIGSTPVRLTRTINDILIALHPEVKPVLPVQLVIDAKVNHAAEAALQILLQSLPSVRTLIFSTGSETAFNSPGNDLQERYSSKYNIQTTTKSVETYPIPDDGLLVLTRKNLSLKNRFFADSALRRFMYKAERSIVVLPEIQT